MSEKQPPKDLDEVILSDDQGNEEVYKILFTFEGILRDDFFCHCISPLIW